MSDKGFFQHPQAIVESDVVGAGTRVWAFAHVAKGATVGARCNIGEQCFIEGGAVVGDDVIVKNGVAVWEGVTVEDGAFLGPSVVLTNETFPRSGFKKPLARTRICRGASIGAGAVLVAPVTIGAYSTVGAGAVVTADVPAHALMLGIPARVVGQVCVCGLRLEMASPVRCSCGRSYRQTGDVAQPIELITGAA